MAITHGLPENVPAGEAKEDRLPLLLKVAQIDSPGLDALYLGNLTAAEDATALAASNVTTTLNLAINLHLAPLALADGSQVRRYQIGMIDGPGNDPAMIGAAISLIDGLAGSYIAGKPHYQPHRRGGLLVHCRGGRSRSVVVLALWLHLRRPADYPTFDAALDHLRQLRGTGPDYPLPPMLSLAQTWLNNYRQA